VGKLDVGCSIWWKEVDAKENCDFGELTYLYVLRVRLIIFKHCEGVLRRATINGYTSTTTSKLFLQSDLTSGFVYGTSEKAEDAQALMNRSQILFSLIDTLATYTSNELRCEWDFWISKYNTDFAIIDQNANVPCGHVAIVGMWPPHQNCENARRVIQL